MDKIYSTYLLGALFLLSSCAGNSQQPYGGLIIDTKGADMSAYYQGIHECRNYASQVNTGGRIAGETVSGAVIGGAIGTIVGDSDVPSGQPVLAACSARSKVRARLAEKNSGE